MRLINGRLNYRQPWSKPHVLLFTGNPVVRRDGGLVMGRGAARELRDAYPGLDIRLGNAVSQREWRHVVWVQIAPEQVIGWFMVKYHWQDDADLALIDMSVWELVRTARNRPELTFHINYPGIGNGRLSETEVGRLLNPLPDNVWVYR